MSVSKEQLLAAENEAKEVDAKMRRQFDAVKEKYKLEKGMDRGAKEMKAILEAGMREIAAIRKKYGIPEPK